jgi:SAM-dependent methyltransferase
MKYSDKMIKGIVRKKYAGIAGSFDLGCVKECCGSNSPALVDIADISRDLGYSNDQVVMGLGEDNLGLGCGNPLAMADLKKGETVLDLGSGAGFDAFLAAKCVWKNGHVIGVDMTPEIIDRARKNAEDLGVNNCEFRLGEIENLPVADNSVDVTLSNCVINLSPDKTAVYREIFRILKPGGRISISDVLRSGEIPREIKEDTSAYTG